MSKNMKAREKMLSFINSHVGAIIHPDTITAHVGCSKSFLFHLKTHLKKSGAVEDVPGTVGGKAMNFYRFPRTLEIQDLAYKDKRTPDPAPGEQDAAEKLKQAKADPLVDGPLFAVELKPGSVVPGKAMVMDPDNTPFGQITKAIKQSEAAILCHLDNLDERNLKRFRILAEKLDAITATTGRWAEIESRLGKLLLSAGRLPALESKIAVLTEEVRKARREIGYMNPQLGKLCKIWEVKS